MTSLEIIKDELARMPESPATKALSVAVDELECHCGNPHCSLDANETIQEIANILSGGEDGK